LKNRGGTTRVPFAQSRPFRHLTPVRVSSVGCARRDGWVGVVTGWSGVGRAVGRTNSRRSRRRGPAREPGGGPSVTRPSGSMLGTRIRNLVGEDPCPPLSHYALSAEWPLAMQGEVCHRSGRGSIARTHPPAFRRSSAIYPVPRPRRAAELDDFKRPSAEAGQAVSSRPSPRIIRPHRGCEKTFT
jgi:hypothetical protein